VMAVPMADLLLAVALFTFILICKLDRADRWIGRARNASRFRRHRYSPVASGSPGHWSHRC
jgi:hypothetical protein